MTGVMVTAVAVADAIMPHPAPCRIRQRVLPLPLPQRNRPLPPPEATAAAAASLPGKISTPPPSEAYAMTRDEQIHELQRELVASEAENARLRRELASTKLDLEIVKKAAAYFAKESR